MSNITRNPASLEAATDTHEIASVLRETTEALATASALLTDLLVSHGGFPAIHAAAQAMVNVLESATGAIDAGRKSLFDSADALAFGEGGAA